MTTSSGKKDRGVNILDPQELLGLAQDTTEGGRARLATAVSDFFKEHKLNEREQGIASDIMLNLLKQAELDLRQALADRLAVQDDVPRDLMVYLANDDEISVAGKVLMHSPVLTEGHLLEIIENKGSTHWQAVAQRPAVSARVSARLVDTKDVATILSLIDNERADLGDTSVKKIVRIALKSEELQAPLLRRPEVDTDTAVSLYMIVSQELRRQIIERFPVGQQYIDRAFEVLVQELSQEARDQGGVSPEMAVLAKRFMDRNEVTPDLMIRTLRRGQKGFFVALFAQRIGFTPDTVMRMVQNKGGKSFIVACRHLNMMKSEFASIFLLSRGLRSGDKIVDQHELAMALKKYDSLKAQDVTRIMVSWKKNPAMI